MDEQRAAAHNRNIVVVGGVAGGMSFAARARRLDESAHIVVLERDPYVSFANCGLPYHLAGEITEREDLLLHTPESLQQSLNLDVRTCHEVVSIDRAAKEVVVRDRNAVADPGDRDDTAAIYRLPYDHLVLSTGASAIVPDIVGIDRPEVRTLRSVPDLDRLLQLVGMGARSAVVLGAGFIGLEVTEALRHRGLDVHVVELADQVLGPIDPEMARAVQRELEAHAVGVHLGVSAISIDAARSDEQGTAAVMLSDGTRLAADVVLVSIGVRPASGLAAAAGLELGDRGAVRVDASLLTSDPNISAVGDAIEVVDAVTGRPAPVPLAGLANRQGRQAADRLLGTTRTRKAVLGTAIVRVFDLVAATTGATEKALVRAGIDFRKVYLHPNQHAGYFPGAKSLHLKVLFAPDGKVLGAQATGSDGVDKRIDVLATAVRAGLTVDDLAELELAYAPPFGSAKDPVNLAGFMAQNLLEGEVRFWYAEEWSHLPEGTVVLDVRGDDEFADGHLPGAMAIPHIELRARLNEVPPDAPIALYCLSGFRSYLAARVLAQSGWSDVRTLAGGLKTFALANPSVYSGAAG